MRSGPRVVRWLGGEVHHGQKCSVACVAELAEGLAACYLNALYALVPPSTRRRARSRPRSTLRPSPKRVAQSPHIRGRPAARSRRPAWARPPPRSRCSRGCLQRVWQDLGVTDARVVCWGLFIAWAVHDTEEVFTATWWSRRTLPRLRSDGWPSWVVDSATTTTARFAVAAAVVGVAVLLVARHGAQTRGRSPIFQAAVLVFGWHGLVHAGRQCS